MPDRSRMEQLIKRMKEHVFPIIKHEVKALCREGHREGAGILSRQKGEPMNSIIQRRERWWDTLKTLDSSVSLSDEMQGEFMLLNYGISELDRKIILTVTDSYPGCQRCPNVAS